MGRDLTVASIESEPLSGLLFIWNKKMEMEGLCWLFVWQKALDQTQRAIREIL